jgi:leucyl/phenylalanyl-tRNA--protein transferase
MDDPDAQHRDLPFYRADPRAVFDISPAGLAATRRVVRRSLAKDPGWQPRVDGAFRRVVAECAQPRADDGIWLTPRMAALYDNLRQAGFAHTFELWDGDELLAGIVGVVLGRAALLETMFHTRPHAGNVNLVRTLERLADAGIELCDIQLISDHTKRLGAIEIPAAEFEARLLRCLGM